MNEQNLLRGNPDTEFKSGREAVEMGRNGGIASGIARRRNNTMTALAQKIANSEITNEQLKKKLSSLGITPEEMTNNAVATASVYQSAIKGNMLAMDKWITLTEAKDEDGKRYELPARVIGKAYCDINREIIPNKTYIFKGGRGSLKSSYVSLKIIELLKNNPSMHACVVRKVASTLRDSVFSQVKWAVHELELDDEIESITNPMEIRFKKTGQKIFFRGCDDPIKLKSIKPTFGYIGILWIEERDQIAGAEEERNVAQSVLRGGAESYMFCSYNPPKSISSWVNKELQIPDSNRVVHESTYRDAPKEWLGQKFIDDAEHLKEVNPEAYDHEYMGISNGSGGLVFDNVEIREITDEEISRFDRIYQGVDWGYYPDYYAFVRVAYESSNETVYVFAENCVNKQSNKQTADWIIEHNYNDYRITCDSAEPKSVNDYKDLGLPAFPAIKGAGSIEYSFKWLQGRKIVIDPIRCPKAMQEIIEYEYEKDKDGNVISGYPDKNNHAIDALRYSLESYWTRRGNQA